MVEPLKPEVLKSMLGYATEEEIAEYERLLSERYEKDPDLPKSDDELALDNARNERLRVLGEKIGRR